MSREFGIYSTSVHGVMDLGVSLSDDRIKKAQKRRCQERANKFLEGKVWIITLFSTLLFASSVESRVDQTKRCAGVTLVGRDLENTLISNTFYDTPDHRAKTLFFPRGKLIRVDEFTHFATYQLFRDGFCFNEGAKASTCRRIKRGFSGGLLIESYIAGRVVCAPADFSKRAIP